MNRDKIYLILGGARSGTSPYAEQLANNYSQKIYLPTALNPDEDLKARIKAHQDRRGNSWQTLDPSLNLAATLNAQSNKNAVILIDCLTLWLFHLLENKRNIQETTETLIQALTKAKGPIIMVSNEVGLSIVPENKLARQFRDAQGTLNQQIAKTATDVLFIAAGLPLILKQSERND